MANKSTNTNDIIDADFDELDALIDGIQDDVIETVETAADDVDIDLLEDVSDDLEEADSVEVEDVPVVVAKPAEEKPAKAAKKPSVSKYAAGSSLAEYGSKIFSKEHPLLLTVNDAAEEPESVTETNLKSFDSVNAVKVREKLANLMQWIASNKSLSKYTMATFKTLVEKGEMTKADVRNNLLDLGLSVGTASSQAGQMTHLLQVTKIATLTGGKFVLNEDSTLAALIDTSGSAVTVEAAAE